MMRQYDDEIQTYIDRLNPHRSPDLQAMHQQAVKAIREGQDVGSVAAAYGMNERGVDPVIPDIASH